MKSFFATAALASAATATMSHEEIGQLVAGIFYEVGIESSLDDFTNCMTHGYFIEQDIQSSVAEFQKGGISNITNGVKDLVDVIHHLPSIFHNCPHMAKEIEAIASWSAQIAHPVELKHQLETNTALHIITLKKDAIALQQELAAKQYFEAGETIGDILTIELGKVSLDEIQLPKINDISSLISGIIYGVSDEGHLSDLSECLVDDYKVEKDFVRVIGDLKQHKIHDAIADLSLIVSDFPVLLSQCIHIKSDLHALEQWLSIVKDFDALKKQIKENTTKNLPTILNDIETLKSDMSAEQYFQAGEVIADLLLIELGDIPTAEALTGIHTIGLKNTEQVIAGLIYGLLNDNYFPEIEICTGDLSNLKTQVEAAIADFKLGTFDSVITGLRYIGYAFGDLGKDFTNCSSGLQDDIARIEEWSKIFTKPIKLSKDITHNILTHFQEALDIIQGGKDAWISEDYFTFGDDIANILVMAVGPVPDYQTPYMIQ